jgi:hypothetical protein
MVDFMGAIKRPFTDVQTLVIGIIIGLIPIVNLLLPGYLVGLANDTMNKKRTLPKWNFGNIVDYIIKTIMVIIIGIVYMIIPAIVLLVAAGAVMMQMLPSITGGGAVDPTMLMTSFMTGGIFVLIGGLLAIVAMIMASMGVMFYVKSNNLMAAFNFNGIIKKVLTGTYWITLIVGAIITFVLMIIAGLIAIIPIVGVFIAAGFIAYVNGCIWYDLFAQVYMETP